MTPSARPTNAVRLLLLGGASLLGCPQLLDDDFTLSSLPAQTGGTGPCPTPGCVFTSGDAAVGGDSGTGPGTGGSGGAAGGSGAAGSGNGGAAGSGAASGAGGAPVDGDGGTTPDATVAPPDAGGDPPVDPCRIVTLNDGTHSSSDNCVGIYGWNAVEKDAASSLTRTFQGGSVCFSGTIDDSDWGAVYNLTLANESEWNANTYGATGFELGFTGSVLPATLKVLYTVNDDRDYCQPITPGGTVSVPFATAHPCNNSSDPSTPDITRLTILQLNFGPGSSPYAVNFCVQIRALP